MQRSVPEGGGPGGTPTSPAKHLRPAGLGKLWVSSAQQEPEVLNALIDDYVARGFCHEVEDIEAARRELGRDPVINKLGIVTKTTESGELKHRIIWDMKQSSANLACSQGERIVLPRLLDLAEAAAKVYRSGKEP